MKKITDKMRLDFLQKNKADLKFGQASSDSPPEWAVYFPEEPDYLFRVYRSARQAIDAAIRREREI